MTDSARDEILTVAESGSDYVFQLRFGVWTGTDGDGFSGAGTSTLRIDTASAAAHASGIALTSDSDVDLDSADFSMLPLLAVTAEHVQQNIGQTLLVSAASFYGYSTTTISGVVTGSAELVQFGGGRGVRFQNATVSTTSGTISVSGGIAIGNFDAVTLVDTDFRTETGRISVTGFGGSVRGNAAPNRGVVLIRSQIKSTGTGTDAGIVEIIGDGGAGPGALGIHAFTSSIITSGAAIRLRGNDPASSELSTASGVRLTDTRVESAEGDITILGDSAGGGDSGNGVELLAGSNVVLTGSGAIEIIGRTRGNSDVGVNIGALVSGGPSPVVKARDAHGVESGGIRIVGHGGAIGISVYDGKIAASGDGNVWLTGVGNERGISLTGHPRWTSVSSTAGDVHLVGTCLAPDAPTRFGPAAGVAIGSIVEAYGDLGDVHIIARVGLASTAQSTSTPALLIAGGGVRTAQDFVFIDTLIRGGSIYIAADSIQIGGGGGIVSPSAGVIISPFTPSVPVVLGGESGPGLHLSDAELDSIGGGLFINGNTGSVRIGGLVSREHLRIMTSGDVTDRNVGPDGKIFFGRLQVDDVSIAARNISLNNAVIRTFVGRAVHDIYVKNSNRHYLVLRSLSAETIFLDVTGPINIASGALDTSRLKFSETNFSPDPPTMPRVQTPFLIRNDGTDAIMNTFAGLPEGALVTTVDGREVRITYKGNHPDGMNDAAIVLHLEPFARDDAYTVPENVGTLFKNVLVNDIDYGNGPLTVTAVNGETGATGKNITLSSGAQLSVDPDGYFYYTPGDAFADLAADEETTDTFTYEVTDAHGGKWTARVLITITGEGTADLVGFNHGRWYVGESNGSSFRTTAWAGWADADWDALRQGDFNGDGRTDVLGLIDGAWFVGISTGSSFTTSLWTQWQNVNWQDVQIADLNSDGKDDILARVGGHWWGALSDGTKFQAPTLWAAWADAGWDFFSIGTSSSAAFAPGTPTLFGFIDGQWWAAQAATTKDQFVAPAKWATLPNVEYDAIKLLDYDGDHGSDFAVLHDGTWTIGTQASYWGPFGDFKTVKWADTDWQDVRIGDFDGDGRDDLLARAGGAWWVMQFHNGSLVTTRWDMWSNVDWQDVTVGDYDGDGLDDVAARYAGAWWVGRSTGSAFFTTLWATWSPTGWSAVFAGDVNGVPEARPTSGSSGSGVSSGYTGGVTTSFTMTTVNRAPQFPLGFVEILSPAQPSDDGSDPEVCEDYPYLNDDGAAGSASDDSFGYPTDDGSDPEICLDYPFLDDDALLDELLTTA